MPDAVLAGVEQLVNRLLALDPETAGRLAPLAGRVIAFEFAGFGTRVYAVPGPAQVQIYGAYDSEPDAVLTGTPLAFARLGMSERKADQIFQGEIRATGDTRLAQDFGAIIAALDIDWEEQLSKIVGDLPAHQVGRGVRALGRWFDRSGDRVAANLADYLQEEGRLLPTRYEVERFVADIDTLRDDVERLAARVARLAGARGPSGSA